MFQESANYLKSKVNRSSGIAIILGSDWENWRKRLKILYISIIRKFRTLKLLRRRITKADLSSAALEAKRSCLCREDCIIMKDTACRK